MNQSLAYKNAIRWTISIVAVAMSLYHMYAIAIAPPEALIFRSTHLLFASVLVFLIYPLRTGADAPDWSDLLMVVLSVVVCGYFLVNYSYIVNRIPYIDDPTTLDKALAIICTGVVLEATRRVIGWALPLTALVFLAYALLLTDVTVSGLLDQLYLTADGIFGSTLGVSAGYVLIFVLFGSFMERTGTGQLFMDFALALTGRSAGGPGKCSVVSSSLFGTISGSAVANVMVDGPITIPLMKRSGFPSYFAAGVEAVASTGGQIMPPVMGAAAFVMAEFMGVSYFQVTLWALIPSLMYYLACFGAVHFEAKKLGLAGLPAADCPRLGTVLKERGHLFIPVLIILYGMFNDYSAPLAALAGTLACFPVAMLRESTRKRIKLVGIRDALIDGAKNCLSVALACASAGIIIGVVALTGAGISFTQIVLHIAQNTLLLALALTMIAGIVLGMGMPTTPAYIVMVSLLVPALIKLGVIEPAAHMFAFYFAILSSITPPVALAVYAAAGLAKSDLWTTGWAAVRIGAAGFIVPFMFVYDPSLLMIGEWYDIASAVASASIGCIFLAAGLQGYFVRHANMTERGLLIVAALLLIKPGWVTDVVGLALAVIVVALQMMSRERKLA